MKSQTCRYLALSLLSGVLETSVVITGFSQFDLTTGLAFALAYQVGCLIRNPLNLSLRGAAYLQGMALMLLPFMLHNLLVLLLLVACISGGIQSARDWLTPKKPPVPVSLKRLVRVTGFITGIMCSAVFGFATLVSVSLISCLVIWTAVPASAIRTRWIQINRRWRPDGYGWVMLVHQIHYFAYAYVLIAHLLNPSLDATTVMTLCNATAISVWFALGWLSYISGETVLKRIFRLSARAAVILGHVWVVICLFLMATYVRNPNLLGIAWVLGGFGGGSVYAIKELAEERKCKADIELWEHYGHNIGVILAFSSISLFPTIVEMPFMVAVGAATGTILLLVVYESKSRSDES